MFKWIGRAKRLEVKIDKLLSYYDLPIAGSGEIRLPPHPDDNNVILMTDEREETIRHDADLA